MKKGGGKQKGSAYERMVCKRLSQFVSNDERDDIFWRSAMSGGRATVQLKKGKLASAQSSDISLIDAMGARLMELYTIECKHYKDLKVANIVYTAKGGIVEFWKQVCKDAKAHSKSPVLIARQNHKPDLIAFDSKGLRHFGTKAFIKKAGLIERAYSERLDMHIFFFLEFLRKMKPEFLDND